jgi:hypothetical protein
MNFHKNPEHGMEENLKTLLNKKIKLEPEEPSWKYVKIIIIKNSSRLCGPWRDKLLCRRLGVESAFLVRGRNEITTLTKDDRVELRTRKLRHHDFLVFWRVSFEWEITYSSYMFYGMSRGGVRAPFMLSSLCANSRGPDASFARLPVFLPLRATQRDERREAVFVKSAAFSHCPILGKLF